MGDSRLDLRLLGELQLVRDGQEVSLPASKKTRALLAYLVATGEQHRRERLCDLLWDGPDDPRGELRWSLSKIRPLLNDGKAIRLKSDRSRVAFEPQDAAVDLARARELLDDIPNAPLEALRTAVALFRGEFLDGLELPACYRFQAWCLAEREALSALRLTALGALVDRLRDSPEEALVPARALVAADPLSEVGQARVVQLLARLGRRREAIAQYEQARRVLERELRAPLTGALDRARRAIAPRSVEPATQPAPSGAEERLPAGRPARAAIPFVGRQTERAEIDRLISEAAKRQTTPVLLIAGEPGIGKSRLLAHLAERMTIIGGLCLTGRAFEAEAARPYGAWLDALRAIPADSLPREMRQNLALLRPDLGPAAATPTDRTRLFDAVLSLLGHLSAQAPLAILLDDLQWLDEASSALLHYLARTLKAPDGGDAVLLACAARPGELADNPAASRTLRALERDERVLEVPLAPLDAAETAELVRAIDPAIDPAAVFAECDGNPLFALELSRTHSAGQHRPGRPLQALIAGQFDTLGEPGCGLVGWASAVGRSFTPDLLAQVAGLGTPQLLAALEALERRGLIRTAEAGDYDFVHDLVRQAAYQGISQPRRKMMHGQIARVLEAMVVADESVAGDLAHHAELAGDHALAARACIIAGERSLRLFATAEAAALAGRGRAHLEGLPDDSLRRELLIGLLKLQVLSVAGPGLRPLPQVAGELAEAVAKAEAAGDHAAAATGHYLLSVLHQETGDIVRAQDSSVRAARAGRGADQATRARQLANTARCLIELETEIPRARALLREAEAALGTTGGFVCELQWGRGLLARWEGDADRAVALIERALFLARDAQDRWREYKCLTWLAMTELERGRCNAARERCRELRAVAVRLGEDEAPFADSLETLAGLAAGDGRWGDGLDTALSRLRAVDDKSYLAYALNAAAALSLHRKQSSVAEAYAREALHVATAVLRRNDVAIAKTTLVRIAAVRTPRASDRAIGGLTEQLADRDGLSARARAAIDSAAAILGAASAPKSPPPARTAK